MKFKEINESEMKQFVNMKGDLGLHVIQFPSGKWGFAGHIPKDLAYEYEDGSSISDEHAKSIQQFGSVALKAHKIKSKSFNSKQEAIDFAKKHGHDVK